MNMLHILGNLTANPESRIVEGRNGPSTVCNFTVAVDRYRHGQKVAEYFRITLWNKAADNAMRYLTKGRQVAVTGPVTCRAYIGNDQKAHCSMEIQDVIELEYGQNSNRQAQAAPGNDCPPPPDDYAPPQDGQYIP